MADLNTNGTNQDGQQQNTNQNNGTQNNQQQQQQNQQQNTNQNTQQSVDVEKLKKDAVQGYLGTLGYDEDTLKGILEKHKEDEEANKTDLEKAQTQLSKLTKELVEERKARTLAEAKLAALKLGAKTDLVDDLVTVAMARVTKEKDINAVVAEIKAGPTGAVYFENTQDQNQQQQNNGKNLTGGYSGGNGGQQNQQQQNNRGSNGRLSDEDFVKQMRSRHKKPNKQGRE